MCGPLNLDLDKDSNDQNRKSFEFKEMEISNLKFFKILHVSSNLSKVWRRFEVWRLGQAMCHVTHPGAKWMSQLLTLALVVPCWWGQLTRTGVGSFLRQLMKLKIWAKITSEYAQYFFKK